MVDDHPRILQIAPWPDLDSRELTEAYELKHIDDHPQIIEIRRLVKDAIPTPALSHEFADIFRYKNIVQAGDAVLLPDGQRGTEKEVLTADSPSNVCRLKVAIVEPDVPLWKRLRPGYNGARKFIADEIDQLKLLPAGS